MILSLFALWVRHSGRWWLVGTAGAVSRVAYLGSTMNLIAVRSWSAIETVAKAGMHTTSMPSRAR